MVSARQPPRVPARQLSRAWKRPARARILRIRDRLREVYGIPRMAPHGRPLDELVLTVLSQSTNDRNRDVAFLRLRARFSDSDSDPLASFAQPPDYGAMLAAPVSDIEEAIRPGGISKVKSVRIQAILAAISRTAAGDPEGPLSLEWMRHAPVAESRDYLCSLPGVGRKTAACVLLFSYGLPDIPVDTHVSRVGTRLGLFRPGAPFGELHDHMLALTPPGQELEFHVNLLRHGRRTCHARNPSCGECVLVRMCPGRYPNGKTTKAITA